MKNCCWHISLVTRVLPRNLCPEAPASMREAIKGQARNSLVTVHSKTWIHYVVTMAFMVNE